MKPRTLAIACSVVLGTLTAALSASFLSPLVVGMHTRAVGVLGVPLLVGSCTGLYTYRSILSNTECATRVYLRAIVAVVALVLVACGALYVLIRVVEAVFLSREGG